jgi:hypothetical protein
MERVLFGSDLNHFVVAVGVEDDVAGLWIALRRKVSDGEFEPSVAGVVLDLLLDLGDVVHV